MDEHRPSDTVIELMADVLSTLSNMKEYLGLSNHLRFKMSETPQAFEHFANSLRMLLSTGRTALRS